MFKSSNVMIKEWVLRSIELNQYSFLLALFCPQKVGFFHSRSHRWGLWCCRSHSRPHRWMLWCWDEACLGGAWVQSPIEAEIVIWWPCAHLDRSAWHSIRFGSVDSSRVCALVDSWVRTKNLWLNWNPLGPLLSRIASLRGSADFSACVPGIVIYGFHLLVSRTIYQ